MVRIIYRLTPLWLVCFVFSLSGETVDYRRDVKPILTVKCLACHNSTAKMSGLSLSSAADAARGGKRGTSIVPGKPDESLLIQMVSGPSPRMPLQSAPLSPSEVATLRGWIEAGAVWPVETSGTEKWWSLQPLLKPPVPQPGGTWARTPVDAFVLARLQEKGLTPSADADRRTLIRRLTYDLHGLPPTWDEIQDYVQDKSPDAYEKVVDRLLASPRYGERWGRHWLDVVHYGESHGYDKDKPRRNAWPYRDYVIRSFNEDKPYARFVKEQLAGDVLYPDDPQGIVATGFIAAGPWDFVGHVELREGTVDKKITRVLDRDDMVMSTMSAFASMTAHCARCHNHKFDPILQEDYYSLQAVFAGVDRADRPFDADPATNRARQALLKKRLAVQRDLDPLLEIAAQVTSADLEKLDASIRALRLLTPRTKEIQQQIDDGVAARKARVRELLDASVRTRTDELAAQVAAINAEMERLPKPQLVYAASPIPAVRPIQVLLRGSVESPGAAVGAGAITAVPGLAPRFGVEPEGARRTALAAWLTDSKNMLAWRSIVNRVWHYHFGTGIVDSPNDFGRMGSLPTHPELLDWLATWFLENGGSMKKLHKLIVMSSVYRQSSNQNTANAKLDAENRYLWRMNRTRLDAESVRDAALAVSGKLDLKMGGPSVEQFFFKDDHSPVYDYTRFDVDSAASRRRSVYRFIVRSVPDPFMERLDCPDSSLVTAKRNVTITAIQALALMNNPFMLKQAEHLSERIRELSSDADGQISWAYRLALGREAAAGERAKLVKYAAEFGMPNACRLILNSNEFLFID
ncbi:MAG: DUF1553 domain-containing protein [Bryobacteraceae bacterium]